MYVDAEVGSAGARRAQLDTSSPRSRFVAADIGVEVAADAGVEGADLVVGCLPGASGTVESLGLGTANFAAWDAVGIADGQAAIGADILSKCVIAIGVGNEAHVVCD